MPIKLAPHQIPLSWDAIKFAAITVNNVPEKDQPLYLHNLLISLLNERSQCFVHLDNERRLQAISITQIIKDIVTGEKTLLVSCLYSFGGISLEHWKEDMEMVKKFAKSVGCVKVTFVSNNERVFEIVKAMNFVERYRSFVLDLEA